MDPMSRLLIERECEALMIDYNIHLDALQIDLFTALFTEDAIWSRVVPSPRFDLVGPRAIADFVESHMRPSPRLRRHMVANARIDVRSPDTAEGFCLGLVVFGPKGEPPTPMGGVELVGEYRDSYRRTPGGWRIARRELTKVIDLDVVAG